MAEKIYLADGYKAIGQKIGGWCMDNRAHVFTGLAVTGTITTGILSARSGARAARKIDRKEEELGRKLSFKEKMGLCGKDFILPATAAIISVGGAVGSDVVNTKTIGIQNAALIASEKAYEKLSQKTKEVLGEKKAKQVEDEIAKEKVEKSGIITQASLDTAPRTGSGTLFAYVDTYSNLLFWSNLDYINCVIKDMRALMHDLRPRGDEYDYYDKIIGVPYSEWLKSLGFDKKVWNCNERKDKGWNKGYSPDGSDDDPIEYYTRPIEWEPGFAVTAIYWEKDPIDMHLGRLIKSSGM